MATIHLLIVLAILAVALNVARGCLWRISIGGLILPMLVPISLLAWSQSDAVAVQTAKTVQAVGLGGLIGAFLGWVALQSQGNRGVGYAAAGLAFGLSGLLSDPLPYGSFGVALGLSLVAAVGQAGPMSTALAVAGLVGASGNVLSDALDGSWTLPPAGTLALVAGSLGAGLVQVTGRQKTGPVVLSLALACGLVEFWVRTQGPFAGMFSGGVLLATAALWAFRRPSGSASTLMMALLWLSAATVAFALAKGLGVMLVSAGASTAWLLLANAESGDKAESGDEADRFAFSLAPILALALYRAFRETNLEATRALDLGQHYALIGLMLGGFLPVVVSEVVQRQSGFVQRSLYALLLLVAAVGGAVLLGPKGAVGLLVGFALVGVLEGGSGGPRLVLGTLLAVALATSFGWLGQWLDLGRTEKNMVLGGLVLVAVVIVALSQALQKGDTGASEPEAGS